MDGGAWWAAVHWVTTSWTWLSDFTFTFHFRALEKEMATYSSVLAWRIPGTEEPGGLPSMGLPNHSPKSECREGCLQEPLPLLRASETRSFPWSPALVSFFKLLSSFWSWLFLFSFHFLVISFFFSYQQFSEYTTWALEKNQYLLKCTENSSCL